MTARATARLAGLALALATLPLLGCPREPTPPVAPVEQPAAGAPATPVDPARIRKLAVDFDVCALTYGGTLACLQPDPEVREELAALTDVEDLWIGWGGPCVRTKAGVTCLLSLSHSPVPMTHDGRVHVPSDAPIVDLSWSDTSACAVTEDGALWCSYADHGSEDAPARMRRFPISGVVDVEIADDIGCALLDDASVRCWFETWADIDGAQTLAEFCAKQPDEPGCGELDRETADWPGPSHGFANASDLAAGMSYACILDQHGTPWCYDEGGSWDITRLGGETRFEAIEGLPPLLELAGGDRHVCGRTRTDEVWCWGNNAYAQLGDGTTRSEPVPTPVRVGEFAELEQLALGFGESCVLAGGEAQCWGWVDTQVDPSPVEIAGIRASALIARETTTCARVEQGWRCWGGDTDTLDGAAAISRIVDASPPETFGEGCRLTGTKLHCFDPDYEETTLELDGVLAVESRYFTVCALLEDRVECHHPGLSTIAPVVIEVPASTAIGGTDKFGCVLGKDGVVRCWDADANLAEVPVPGKQVQLATRLRDACSLDASGSVHCWTPETPPARAAVADIVELATAASHTCARDRSGAVWCWGYDLVLGDRDEAKVPPPSKPLGLALPAPAVELALGSNHGCARLDDDRVYCWGSKADGQHAVLSPEYVLKPSPILSRDQ